MVCLGLNETMYTNVKFEEIKKIKIKPKYLAALEQRAKSKRKKKLIKVDEIKPSLNLKYNA